ncbi:Glutamyl-tRNA reductase [Bacteroidales bacterium Barb7]|nr:Glutamyl-tRNA reductase [Bacteroidales bacterium Barb7]
MIQCKVINNANHTLEERESLSGTVYIADEEPHVFLQTCNRIELYWGEGTIPEDIIRHLFRVASGLESALIGERAIQGQLKNAYLSACAKYKLPAPLHKLFQTAMHTGKRVRTETKIAQGAVSHSQVTVDILKKEQPDLRQKAVSIIGVNKITEDILKFLTDNQTLTVFLSNRNFEKAARLAATYNGTAIPLQEKKCMLDFTDILITATSAPHTIITPADIPPNKELLIFDLAFPRDVEPSLARRKGIKLYDLESIEGFAKANLQQRTQEIQHAEAIIEEEIAKLNLSLHKPFPNNQFSTII